MSEWGHVLHVYCPQCAALALWAGPREDGGRVAYCVRCNSRIVLKLTTEAHLSPQEREILREVRQAANVDSNSARGAFG